VADVEQPFGCLIVQNRQAMQSMGNLIDWTLEGNMIDGLFFCDTPTSGGRGQIPFVQAGAETSDTGAEAVKPDPGSSWQGHSRTVSASAGDESTDSCNVLRPLCIPSVIRPERRASVIVVVR